jgi:hypothetical protein
MHKPNFFIVGAAKSGTTSLWQYLKDHPQVFMPKDELDKEPRFFSSYGESMGIENYLYMFEKATENQKLVGESSTAYLTDPVSAKMIHDFNSQSKIIIMLRNPADRAYSLYNWMVQDGYEYACSFEEALDLEEKRYLNKIPTWFEPEYYWNYMYFRSGLYYEQVKRYLELFHDNVLIVKFDDFKKDTPVTYRRICSFLKIEPNEIPFETHNPSKAVVSPKIQFILRHLNNFLLDIRQTPITSTELENQITINYHLCFNKLSEVTNFTSQEEDLGRSILEKLISIVTNNNFFAEFNEINTKAQRDNLLDLGLKTEKPHPLDIQLKNILLEKYKTNIEHLSSLTKHNFAHWLSS